MYICEHGYTSESNYRKGQKKDRATVDLIKRREEKRKIAQDADMFSKLVMEMVL